MNINKGLKYLSSVDSKMNTLINTFPYPVFNSQESNFSSLVKYVIYQQLSGKAALSILNRYKALFFDNNYQDPKKVISIDTSALELCGLSKQKISYIRNVATFFIDSASNIDFCTYSNTQIREILIKIKGVGPWTINMFLMFNLKRPNIMPFTDLAIQKGFKEYYNLNTLPTITFMEEKSKLWEPFKTLASIYLWYLVDNGFEW